MTQLNGAPAELDELKALALMNYGHFTSMRIERGGIRGLTLHLARLARDSRTVFDAELDLGEVRTLVREAVQHIEPPVIARVTVFDPDLELGHPGDSANPSVLVTKRQASKAILPPLTLSTVVYEREFPYVKHIGLFGTLKHRRDAQRRGFDDVLFTDHSGVISEGATWNIGFIRGDQVVWPNGEQLAGVTMDLLRATIAQNVIETITSADIHRMDGAFVTNAAIGVRPISGIGDTRWDSEHPTIEVLRKTYAEIDPEGL
jgi:branched-subunit amino acid aminotransferase/4-amino-4-deoxychorismate lyase